MLPGKRLYIVISLYLLTFIVTVGPAHAAKSVYVISDTEVSEMEAYRIDGANLIWQTDYDFVSSAWGAVAIAIDDSEYGQFLFVTFEWSDEIELVNAKTMQQVKFIDVSDELAGIVYDLPGKTLNKTRNYDIILHK